MLSQPQFPFRAHLISHCSPRTFCFFPVTPKTVPASLVHLSSVAVTHTHSVRKLNSHPAQSSLRVTVTGRVCSVPLPLLELSSIGLGEPSQDSAKYRDCSICPGWGPWRTGGTESILQVISRTSCLPPGLLSSQQKADPARSPLPHCQCQNSEIGNSGFCGFQRQPGAPCGSRPSSALPWGLHLAPLISAP